MNFLFYGIITTAGILFFLIILLLIVLMRNRTVYQPQQNQAKHCITCGQILDPQWNRCPFCTQAVNEIRDNIPAQNIPYITPVGYLFVAGGADRGKVYKMEKNKVSIGSGNYNDIVINDDHVSPEHVEIWNDNNKFYVRDLNSRMGTKINNKLINQIELFDNAVIDVGSNLFVFRILS